MCKVVERVKKHTRRHLPTFHRAWHVHADIYLFRVIFTGLVIIIIFFFMVLLYLPEKGNVQNTFAQEAKSLSSRADWVAYNPRERDLSADELCERRGGHCVDRGCVNPITGKRRVLFDLNRTASTMCNISVEMSATFCLDGLNTHMLVVQHPQTGQQWSLCIG